MKKTFGFAISALALALTAAPLAAQQYGGPPQQGYPQQQQGYPQQGYQQGQRWDAPPSEFNDLNRRAFHDGMDAAHSDWQARRPLDPHRSFMFRRPPTDRQFRDEYRNSFARGYQVAVEHRDRWMDHDHDHWNDRDHDHDRDPR